MAAAGSEPIYGPQSPVDTARVAALTLPPEETPCSTPCEQALPLKVAFDLLASLLAGF